MPNPFKKGNVKLPVRTYLPGVESVSGLIIYAADRVFILAALAALKAFPAGSWLLVLLKLPRHYLE